MKTWRGIRFYAGAVLISVGGSFLEDEDRKSFFLKVAERIEEMPGVNPPADPPVDPKDLEDMEEFGLDGGVVKCPHHCNIPSGFETVQVSRTEIPYGFRCSNNCGRWMRFSS